MPSGNCSLCGVDSDLSFEHIPPRAAANKTTRFVEAPYLDYIKDLSDMKFKGRVHQGGIGFHSLCSKCNNFLGTTYVASYSKYSNSLIELVERTENNHFKITMENFQPVKVLKQIIAMFLSVNQLQFRNHNNDLKNYVINPKSNALPERFRFFNYLIGRQVPAPPRPGKG